MSRWQAVIFDLDDTIFPETQYVWTGFRAVAKWAYDVFDIPVERTHTELWELFELGARGDVFDRWVSRMGLSEDNVASMIEVYRRHKPELAPFPGIPPLLEALRGKARLAVVSDGFLSVQRMKFEALALDGHFSAVVFSDQWGREFWKPHHRPFQGALHSLNVSAAHAVYVGDNCTKDFFGARELGMSTIWARHSGGDYARCLPASPAHAADFIAENLDELRGLLLG